MFWFLQIFLQEEVRIVFSEKNFPKYNNINKGNKQAKQQVLIYPESLEIWKIQEEYDQYIKITHESKRIVQYKIYHLKDKSWNDWEIRWELGIYPLYSNENSLKYFMVF